MTLKFMRFFLVVATTLVGYYFAPFIHKSLIAQYMGVVGGLIAGVFIVIVELLLERNSVETVVAGALGLIIGLVTGNLFAYAVGRVIHNAPDFLYAVVVLIFGYLGTVLAVVKRDEISFLASVGTAKTAAAKPKILDTSVIIDGRIADLLETGFLEGVVVIPRFVLNELQAIADSSNPLKRTRGRRGLEMLNKIQKTQGITVDINETDYDDVQAVDEKLVRLSKEKSGSLVTNDYNLNQIAELHGVEVLNVNDLSNALKPVVLPGELMSVQVVKTGKEKGQGVGYLEDGTMIVVESGKDRIGEELDVLVTSVLQTTAGRMIFTRIPDAADLELVKGLGK